VSRPDSLLTAAVDLKTCRPEAAAADKPVAGMASRDSFRRPPAVPGESPDEPSSARPVDLGWGSR
jgi:hypothetical protein